MTVHAVDFGEGRSVLVVEGYDAAVDGLGFTGPRVIYARLQGYPWWELHYSPNPSSATKGARSNYPLYTFDECRELATQFGVEFNVKEAGSQGARCAVCASDDPTNKGAVYECNYGAAEPGWPACSDAAPSNATEAPSKGYVYPCITGSNDYRLNDPNNNVINPSIDQHGGGNWPHDYDIWPGGGTAIAPGSEWAGTCTVCGPGRSNNFPAHGVYRRDYATATPELAPQPDADHPSVFSPSPLTTENADGATAIIEVLTFDGLTGKQNIRVCENENGVPSGICRFAYFYVGDSDVTVSSTTSWQLQATGPHRTDFANTPYSDYPGHTRAECEAFAAELGAPFRKVEGSGSCDADPSAASRGDFECVYKAFGPVDLCNGAGVGENGTTVSSPSTGQVFAYVRDGAYEDSAVSVPSRFNDYDVWTGGAQAASGQAWGGTCTNCGPGGTNDWPASGVWGLATSHSYATSTPPQAVGDAFPVFNFGALNLQPAQTRTTVHTHIQRGRWNTRHDVASQSAEPAADASSQPAAEPAAAQPAAEPTAEPAQRAMQASNHATCMCLRARCARPRPYAGLPKHGLLGHGLLVGGHSFGNRRPGHPRRHHRDDRLRRRSGRAGRGRLDLDYV
jgi:hypothetical protein